MPLSYDVRARNIRQEGNQPDNAWVGFVVTDRDGNQQTHVNSYTGDFNWKSDQVELVVDDPAKLQSIAAAVFLTKSGDLSVDNLKANWE